MHHLAVHAERLLPSISTLESSHRASGGYQNGSASGACKRSRVDEVAIDSRVVGNPEIRHRYGGVGRSTNSYGAAVRLVRDYHSV